MASIFLAPLRVSLYVALIIFSLILFGLTAKRIHYTLTLPPTDPLNHGESFYDPIVVELLFLCIITVGWSFFAIHTVHKRRERRYATTFASELVALFVLWIFWLIGAAVATSIWTDLSFCWSFSACRILTALVAFAWIGFITLTILGFITALFALLNKAWGRPMHGQWDRTEKADYAVDNRDAGTAQPRNTV